MNAQSSSEPPIDPRLNDLLNLLREVPSRDPEAEARGRTRFLAEIDSLLEGEPQRVPAGVRFNPPNTNSHKRWKLPVARQRLAFTYLMAIIAMLVIFFGGAGVTAYASQTALPGDALYPVKTGLEVTQARLSRDAARQAQLYMNFAERRLDEIALLVAQGRFEDVDQAALEFETSVHRAINTLHTVAAGDPIQAQALAIQISNALTRYADILKGMLTIVPDPVKPALQKAILFSETEATGEIEFEGMIESITPEGWIISGRQIISSPHTEIKGIIQVGMLVKVHVLVSEDGSFIAQEIEPIQTNDEQNTNDNNDEDESNDNEDNAGEPADDNEEDGDDEEDDQLNDNTNENQNSNSNQNENTGNDNDNGEEDDNSNQNGNDNEGNDNSDDVNDNQNDNDDDSNENDNDDHENENNNDND